MKNRLLRISTPLLFAGLLALPAGAAAEKTASQGKMHDAQTSEQRFMVEAAMGNLAEVNLGELSQEKAGSEQVKQLGATIRDDHQAANQQVEKILSAAEVKMPERVDKKHLKDFTKLSQMPDKDFDKEYLSMMESEHKKDIEKYQKWQKQAQSADVKQYIEQTLPVLEKHLKLTQDLQKQMKSKQTS